MGSRLSFYAEARSAEIIIGDAYDNQEREQWALSLVEDDASSTPAY